MRLIDISRSFFHSEVYKGDPIPKQKWITRMENGDSCTLSSLSGCVHTATHADAPLHFLVGGTTIDQVDLSRYYGRCVIITAAGCLKKEWAVKAVTAKGIRRILIRGNGKAYLSKEAAGVLAANGILLVGTDAQSVGSEEEEEGPHRELLSRGIAVLEGLDLSNAEDGSYLLSAFPIKLDGAEGAPVRAVLIQEDH